jgi:hypothetical protein
MLLLRGHFSTHVLRDQLIWDAGRFDEAEELGLGDFLTIKSKVEMTHIILGLLWQRSKP